MWDTHIVFRPVSKLCKLLCILPIVLISGCEQEVAVSTQNIAQVVVTGELKPGKQPNLNLSLAGNLTVGTPPQSINEAIVTVAEIATSKTYSYRNLGNGKWVCETLVPQADRSYKLTVFLDGTEVNATANIPPSVEAKVITNGAENPTYQIQILSPKNENYGFIVSLQSKNTQGDDWENETVFCGDDYTDNYRYKELPTTYDKFFLRTTSDRPINIASENHQNTVLYRLIIKCVERQYYHYLYNYECTKQGLSPIFNNNITNGIGVFGGSTEKIVEF